MMIGRLMAVAALTLGAAPTTEPRGVLFGAPGRIEGAHPTIAIGAGITAVVRDVLVREGDRVTKGQVLVRLDCDDLTADIDRHAAEQRAAEAHAATVRLGARIEAVDAAAAEIDLAKARWVEAGQARERNSILVRGSAGTRRDLLIAERDERMAAAQHEAARRRLDLLLAGPRAEEVVEAQARADAARSAHEAAMARRTRCVIRSPVDGTIVGQPVLAGELLSTAAPRPVALVADLSRLRVRAEVDEADVARLRQLGPGQKAMVVTNRGMGTRLTGRVVEIAQRMGRRQVLTNDPAERSDRDVLDVIVQLDGTDIGPMPIGLRVSVLFGEPDDTGRTKP